MNWGLKRGMSGPLELEAALGSVSTNLAVVVTHNRSRPPQWTRWVLRCKSPDAGYVAGDEVELLSLYSQAIPPTIWANTSQIGLTMDATRNNFEVFNKTSFAFGVISYPKWVLKVYAQWR